MATLNSTTGTNGLAAGTGGSSVLPRSISGDIWKLALAKSIVPQLATSKPMILGDNIFPTLTKRPSASIVGEGGNKVDSELEIGSKTVRPIKAVVGLEFTMEAIMTNPAGVLDLLGEELSGALSRQIDLAVFHKRVAVDGSTISGVEALSDTTNEQALDTVPAASAGGMDKLIWDGYNTIVDANFEFTGFAMDPRLVYTLSVERDTLGNRRHPELSMRNQGLGDFEGQPVGISRTVSGRSDGSEDTGIRAFGGDFTALKFGHVLDIPVRKIEYGDPFGNGDLQRRNSVAYMAEVIFGWAILDVDAFVKYTVDLTP